MPSFAELKQKAAKAKDASVEKYQNTRDRNTSVPLKKTNWDPYNKNGPQELKQRPAPPPKPSFGSSYGPPPGRSNSSSPVPAPGPSSPPPAPRPTLPSRTSSTTANSAGQAPPVVKRTTKPSITPSSRSSAAPPPMVSSPPPMFPVRRVAQSKELDWTNLSAQDKETFFSWLDEFFSGYLGRPIGPNS